MSLNLRSRVADRSSTQKKITETFKEAKVMREAKRKSVKISRDENKNENLPASIPIKPQESAAVEAKRALHISAPGSLPCREAQIEEVMEFVRGNLENGKPGSMYISGAPGTGKTAVVKHVISKLKETRTDLKFVDVIINCMNLREPGAIYDVIYKQLNIKSTKPGDMVQKISDRAVSKTGRPAVIVLDEMDQLLTASKEILYRVFEWTRLPGSKFTLIGIANSLDLTVRHIPLLTASPKSMSPKARTPAGMKSQLKQQVNTPQASRLMQFPPYERADIEKILESRMTEIGNHIFDPTAIKFVAAKVSATTGDMRKALNACQIALDATEKSHRPILKATADDGFNSSSPKKICVRDEKIGIAAMAKILAPKKDEGVLPLQQKIILATLLKINKEAPSSVNVPQDGVSSAIPLTAFYEVYRKVCTDKGFSWIDRSELSSICELLEDRSVVHVTESSKTTPGKKVKTPKSGKAGIFFQPQTVLSLLKNDPIIASVVG